MKTVIFEGICTSGKTSTIERLQQILHAHKLPHHVVTEDKAKKAMFTNPELTKSLRCVEELFVKNMHKKKHVVFDRLYLSLVSRCEQPHAMFKKLEERIVQYGASIVFLYIPPKEIKRRLINASLHRGPEWKHYLESMGGIETATTYYKSQQNKFMRYLKLGPIPHIMYDTRSQNYEDISESVYKTFLK